MSNDKQTTAVRQFINDTLKGKAKETEYYLALERQQIQDAWCAGYDEDDRLLSSSRKYFIETFTQ